MAGEVKEKNRTGMSVAALTLGIVSIVFGLFWYICIPTGILAIVFGAKTARKEAVRLFLPALIRRKSMTKRSSCADDHIL